jgi:hypothetical protein
MLPSVSPARPWSRQSPSWRCMGAAMLAGPASVDRHLQFCDSFRTTPRVLWRPCLSGASNAGLRAGRTRFATLYLPPRCHPGRMCDCVATSPPVLDWARAVHGGDGTARVKVGRPDAVTERRSPAHGTLCADCGEAGRKGSALLHGEAWPQPPKLIDAQHESSIVRVRVCVLTVAD